jgi:hypothetical protein
VIDFKSALEEFTKQRSGLRQRVVERGGELVGGFKHRVMPDVA